MMNLLKLPSLPLQLLLSCSAPLFITTPLNAAEEGELDLTALYNYASQATPTYITKDNTPALNPISDIGATLGRVLFYDKRLSKNNTISCSSCHKQEHAFSDQTIASVGVNGTTGRHSMRLINARFSAESKFFWDERAVSLEDQTTQPIRDHIEMGFSGADGDQDFAALVTRLSAIEDYQVLFTGVYGDSTINEDRIQQAISQFIRSIQSFDSKFDLGRAAVANNEVNFPNYTAAENAGKTLFLSIPPQGGAGCAACHSPPEFDIDPNSANNGVVGSLGGGSDFTNTRSPSLRDLTNAAGTPHTAFMHNGSLTSLLDVVNHYNAIPALVTGLDPRLTQRGQPQQLNLTQTEKDNLVAFLNTLTGTSVYTDQKWSSPFDPADQLSIIILPINKTVISFTGSGSATTVTVTSPAAPNLEYIFQTSTDLETWTSTEVTATTEGILTVSLLAPEADAKKFYRFAYIPSE